VTKRAVFGKERNARDFGQRFAAARGAFLGACPWGTRTAAAAAMIQAFVRFNIGPALDRMFSRPEDASNAK